MGVLAIVLLTFAVYSPVIPGSFLMDDERLVGRDNPLVNGQLTLCTLWFGTDFTLATFGWWLEHLAFGPNPAGYHIVSILFQCTSAVLLWQLLKRLKIPGAWVAAALFAVHPVCVNSVARIAELKNTLSMPFFLLSYIAYLRYEATVLYPAESSSVSQQRSAGTIWYVVSFVAFLLALMAKTTVVMLPVLILFCAAWQRRRIQCRDVVHTVPFFVLSLAFGLMSIWFQKYQALPTSEVALQPISFLERLAAAGYDFWFYVGKALLPFNLSIEYPRWKIDAHTLTAYLPDLFACAIFVLFWCFRRTWGRHALFGMLCFAVMLFPALGFFDAQFLTLWQVSDHLQYSALPAILALVIGGFAALSSKTVFRGAAIILLTVSLVLSFSRAIAFSTQERLMSVTIANNPSAWGAANDLGAIYAENKDYTNAVREFELSLKYNPNDAEAHMNLGYTFLLEGKPAEAEAQYVAALKSNPGAGAAHKTYANLLQDQGKNAQALYHLRMAAIFNPDVDTYMTLASLEYVSGDLKRAVADLQHALALRPNASDEVTALNNLAWVIATCPDKSVRNGNEAVRYAEQACQLTGYRQQNVVNTLAAAYAEAGRFSDAVATAETALNLAKAAGDVQSAAASQRLLLLYQAGKSYHEPSQGHPGQ